MTGGLCFREGKTTSDDVLDAPVPNRAVSLTHGTDIFLDAKQEIGATDELNYGRTVLEVLGSSSFKLG